ncbi:MAG: PIG-L family deacetylase [Candidatus Pacebacteria bacterium]|nr:PIG-L family deacetylase [Candidatus Paceibacterota bacterium]
MQSKKVLVIGAHPDDEVLGCGGTILKHLNHGDMVSVLILGEGETSKEKNMIDIEGRKKAAQKAAQILGVSDLFLERLPDNQFDSLPLLKIVKKIESHLLKIKPEIVYTHFANDLNIDHRTTFKAALTACRPQPCFFVKKILSFEILSSTEWQAKNIGKMFRPTVYENITDFIAQKLKAMQAHEGELKNYPHPRSLKGIEVQAQYRGIESGYKFAEAFQLIRDLHD